MLQHRVTRQELFEADSHSCDWQTHQLWRIERCKARAAEQLGLPLEKIHLIYQDKQPLELINRKGEHTIYRPEGIITECVPGRAPAFFMEFEVSWVDPWLFAHRATRTFTDIIIGATDEFTYLRKMREIRRVRESRMV
ncbi:hypothetical protein [Pseudomonas sp. S1(2024)]|uniref:hypothetical protein n=1 Tax=Pseudomonas sp. S1(2024) TaxID=3390191 RepID=UPI00397E80A7